jgi:hypothetical protein
VDAHSPSYRQAVGNHRDNAVLARRAGVKTLVLSHFLAEIGTPDVRGRIVEEIGREFGGPVVWGEDLMRLSLAQGRPLAIDAREGRGPFAG